VGIEDQSELPGQQNITLPVASASCATAGGVAGGEGCVTGTTNSLRRRRRLCVVEQKNATMNPAAAEVNMGNQNSRRAGRSAGNCAMTRSASAAAAIRRGAKARGEFRVLRAQRLG